MVIMYGMTNAAMYRMMNGSQHGMGWGGSVVSLLFTVLVFIVLILIIMALLKYLRKPN